MTRYVDTSALLRLVLGEPGALDEIADAERLVSSELLAVESRRTIDRLQRMGTLPEDEALRRLDVLADWLEAVDLVLLRAPILARAGDPLPMPLGTLDALHLATALVWRDRMQEPLGFATHDSALAAAARLHGFAVVGA
ncbi:MAG: type II toxin-antitoxin system VapC family toxin [Vicinamibacterales bacterium]